MKELKRLANQFREAVDVAKGESETYKDNIFRNFPPGCCGEPCDVSGQFLLEHEIEIFYQACSKMMNT
ncbi:MAG: hypothetical protein LHW44_04000 [Candidatus Cloacimonetes bacterium]|nr:hypothetical protein [Candidatus Cloacimonadota bacterium]